MWLKRDRSIAICTMTDIVIVRKRCDFWIATRLTHFQVTLCAGGLELSGDEF